MKEPLDRILDRARDKIAELVFCALRSSVDKCESPIEVALLQAIGAYQFTTYGRWPKVNDRPGECWHIQTQVQIDKYRVDFLLVSAETSQRFVIECDGHNFHERTKEQAQRDRQRDRDLTAAGYIVLRFTGSEIWRDPWSCVEQIEEQVWSAERREDDTFARSAAK